jgi:hypothetical protein
VQRFSEGNPAMQSETSAEQAQPTAREAALMKLVGDIRAHQSLSLGIVGGLLGAVIAAFLWAAITAATHFQIGYMALAVGFIVGFGVRTLGRGIDRSFGYVGAVLSLLGCVVGNLAAAIVTVSQYAKVPILTILAKLTPQLALSLWQDGFQVMDLFFYGFAVYSGYRYAFRRLTESEIASLPD